jgi:glycosyltransferase involved in cell wall biosynthesis
MAGPGVNVVGYFNRVIGIGESARLFAAALRAADIEHSLAAIEPVGAQAPLLEDKQVPWLTPAALPHDTTVVWCNPDRYGLDVDVDQLTSRHVVGRWAWELPELPETWRRAGAGLTEIWTPSAFVADAVSRGTGKPVRVVPPAFAPADAAPFDRERWGLPADGRVFAFMFDHNSTLARKNPLGLIEAFTTAFDGNGEATLLVKALNAGRDRTGAAVLLDAVRAHPSVRLFSGLLSLGGRNALLAGCDCYVSLHRSEGFGLTLAEAMAYGRPVIATGFGGNLDFTDDETAYLVRSRPAAVGDGVPIYPPEAEWAEPDLDHAAELMRRVLADPGEARERGEAGRARVRARHAPDVVGAAVGDELERLAAAS